MCDRAGKLTNNDLCAPFYATKTLHIPMSMQDTRVCEPGDFKMVKSFLRKKQKKSAILTVKSVSASNTLPKYL